MKDSNFEKFQKEPFANFCKLNELSNKNLYIFYLDLPYVSVQKT
jgi:hypothetical protein